MDAAKTMDIERTSKGLRNALFDEINGLRNGSSNPARARSIASLANAMLQSVITEIEYHRYVSDLSAKATGAKLGMLELGGEPVALESESSKSAAPHPQ